MSISAERNLDFNRSYQDLVFSDKRYMVLVGGAGSGKSVFAAQKIIFRCIYERNNRFLIIRKVSDTLRESVFKLIIGLLDEYGIRGKCEINKTEKTIVFWNGNEIIMKGADDPEKIKSIAGITGIWIEEATELTEDDFDQLDLRLRGETDNYKQITLTFNPIDERHWLKKRFFDTEADDCITLTTTFRDNEFLDEDYKRVLENKARVNPNYYRIYYLGEWGVPDVQSPFMYNFKDHHIAKTQIIESVPLIFSIDFNVEPFVCTVSQIWNDRTGHHIHTHREHILHNQGVKEMIELLKTSYTKLQLSQAIFTGDATQRKRTVEQAVRGTQHLHSWIMIDEAFRLGKRLKVPSANPSVASSREVCNYALALHPDIRINQDCRLLINEMQFTEADENGGILKKDRNKESQRADALDTWRYLIMTFCSDIISNSKKYGIK